MPQLVSATPPRARGARGFTLIELMTAVAVIAILCMIALPSLQGQLVRSQIIEAAKLADIAKAPIAAAWSARHPLPADNAAAGLPAADRIVSNLVSAVQVDAGAIHMTFGNQANAALRGKVLSFRPGVVEDASVVPVAWVCGHARAPEHMVAKGEDRTTVPDRFLPMNCR
jgi:type IV pilus assembly protein PilA